MHQTTCDRYHQESSTPSNSKRGSFLGQPNLGNGGREWFVRSTIPEVRLTPKGLKFPPRKHRPTKRDPTSDSCSPSRNLSVPQNRTLSEDTSCLMSSDTTGSISWTSFRTILPWIYVVEMEGGVEREAGGGDER